MSRQETVRQFATRIGYTWAEWRDLPLSEKGRLIALDKGEVWECAPQNKALMDLPGGEDRMAAFRAALSE